MRAAALPRRRSSAALLAASLAVVSALLGRPADVSASTNTALQGALSTFPVASASAPAQLFAGTDGRLWFVTAQSQLGAISGAGQASLTGVTLPHGSVFGAGTPATIAAAGAEGVWSFAATVNLPPATNSCVVTLVTAAGTVMQPTLPASLADFSCTSAAADASGALWVGLVSGKFGSVCKCRVAIVAEITSTGQVTLFNPLRPGARPLAVALGGDGAIWVLQGSVSQQYGRYTASGPPSALSIGSCCGWQGMLARPDGSFWLLRQIFCSGLTPPFCPKVEVSQPGGLSSSPFLYPVSAPNGGGLSMPLRTAVGPDGSLWLAGQQSSGPDRLFRMDATGQIDRSAALTGAGATALLANGPIAVTPAGAVWAVASAGSSTYLVRYILG